MKYILVTNNGDNNEWEFWYNLGVFDTKEKAISEAKENLDYIQALAGDDVEYQQIWLEEFTENKFDNIDRKFCLYKNRIDITKLVVGE